MICEKYKSRILYYNMMKEYIENKITALKFKSEYFNNLSEDTEYSDPYFHVLKTKLSNKELFEEKNLDLLYEVEDTINAMEFSNKYCKQRHNDLNEAKKSGHTYDIYQEKMNSLKHNEKVFQEKYSDVLHEEGIPKIKRYEQ